MVTFRADRKSIIRLPFDDEHWQHKCFYAAISDYDSGGVNEGNVYILLAHALKDNTGMKGKGEPLRIRYLRLNKRTIADSFALDWLHTKGGTFPRIAVSPKWGHLAFENKYNSISVRYMHEGDENISRRHLSSLSSWGVLQLHVLDDKNGQGDWLADQTVVCCDQHENLPVGQYGGHLVVSKDGTLAAFLRDRTIQILRLQGGPMASNYTIGDDGYCQPGSMESVTAIGNRILATAYIYSLTVYLFEIQEKEDRFILNPLTSCPSNGPMTPRMVAVSADDRFLALFTPRSRKISMWELNPTCGGKHKKLRDIHVKEPVSAIRFLGENTLFVISQSYCRFYDCVESKGIYKAQLSKSSLRNMIALIRPPQPHPADPAKV